MNQPKAQLVRSYNEMLLGNRKEWTTDTCNNACNMDEWGKHAQPKKSKNLKLLLYDPVSTKL